MTTQSARPLRRILGLGFGLALVFGSTIGVGILRLPGLVAAALGDRTLIMVFWALGGLYALMGAVTVAELAAMIPETGGFRVYARRAFGEGVGFAIGWCDWLQNIAALAYVSMTAVTFLGVLWPAAAANPRALTIALIAAFTGIHWIGLRIGSSLTAIISVSIGLMLMILVVGCFLVAPATGAAVAPLAGTAASAAVDVDGDALRGGAGAARDTDRVRWLVRTHLHGGGKYRSHPRPAARPSSAARSWSRRCTC